MNSLQELSKSIHKFYKLATKLSDLSSILQKIEEMDSFAARKRYAEKHLKHLSSGSSRIVYKTNNNSVIKLAKNDRGLAQNKIEANPKMKNKYLNSTISHAKNFSWIEVNFIKKITEKEFKKLTNLDFSDFGKSISYELRKVSKSDHEKPKEYEEISKSEIFQELSKLGKKFKLMPGDMERISSWGKIDDHPILIDAGLTKEIFDKYY